MSGEADTGFKAPLPIPGIHEEPVVKNDCDDPPQVVKPEVTLPAPLTSLLPPVKTFYLMIMKNGTIIDKVEINKSRIAFGRSRECEIPMDHPSISRYHAVILWKEASAEQKEASGTRGGFFYVMDLNSTHGTVVNKQKINGGVAVKIEVNNNVIKFGGSTRMFTVTCPDMDEEDGDDEDPVVTLEKKREDDAECMWGMGDDAVADGYEEDDAEAQMEKILSLINTYHDGSSTPNSHAFSDNPNKCLQQWFEREGYDFEFDCHPSGSNFKCCIKLPIGGRDIQIEAQPKSRKKEAISDACLKCCKILDLAERLFPWQQQEKVKRRKRRISDDEDDDILDETQEFREKKLKKSMRDQKDQKRTETFESLLEKWTDAKQILISLKTKLESMGSGKLNVIEKQEPNKDDLDSLDTFMSTISSADGKESTDVKIEKSKIRLQIKDLEKKQRLYENLMKIAKPSFTFPESLQIKPVVIETPQVKSGAPDVPKTNVVEVNSPPSSTSSSEPKPSAPSKVAFKMKSSKTVPTQVLPYDSMNTLTGDSNERKLQMGVGDLLKRSSEPMKIKRKKVEASESSFEPDFVDWVPPEDQDGSGKTRLNAKLGY